MHLRYLTFLALGIAAVTMTVLPTQANPLADDQTVKLPCGRTVKILSVSRVESSKGVMALLVRYQTTLSVDERKAVSEEVDDVWKLTVPDVEHSGYSEAIITTNETPTGVFLTSSRILTFIYEKGTDGKWTRLNRSDLALR